MKVFYDIMAYWLVSRRKRWGWRFWDLKKNSELRFGLGRSKSLFDLGEARPGVYGMPARWLNQWVESWRCTNSQHSKKLCLSLLMSGNLKLKKVNKSFVPEPRKLSSVSSVFGFLYEYEHYERFMHVNILVVFLDVDMLYLCIDFQYCIQCLFITFYRLHWFL